MELRLYSFVNFYLSSIQQGIQTGHAAVDLVRKYEENNAHPSDEHIDRCDMVIEWADDYKTFIILNGGDLKNLTQIDTIVAASGFPWVYFHESEEALGGMLSCIAVVLPASIFDTKIRQPDLLTSMRNFDTVYEYVDPDTTSVMPYYSNHKHYELIKLLRSSRLAS